MPHIGYNMRARLVTARTARIAAMCGLLLAAAKNGSPQAVTWEDRAFLNISVSHFGHFSTSANLSQPSLQLTTETRGSRLVDLTMGVRTWPLWGVGFTYAYTFADSAEIVGASPAIASGPTDARFRSSLFSPVLFYMLPLTDRIDMMVLGGPGVARVSHEVPAGVVAPGGERLSGTLFGATAAVDFRYLLTDRLAVGTFVRYNGVRGDLTGGVRTDIEGWEGGTGLRIRF
jgi:hypothetical protein